MIFNDIREGVIMSDNGNDAGFGVGLIIGMLAGAALALFYAPRPGHETRAMLRQKAAESRGRAEEIIENARERAKKIIDDAKGRAPGPDTDIIP